MKEIVLNIFKKQIEKQINEKIELLILESCENSEEIIIYFSSEKTKEGKLKTTKKEFGFLDKMLKPKLVRDLNKKYPCYSHLESTAIKIDFKKSTVNIIANFYEDGNNELKKHSLKF